MGHNDSCILFCKLHSGLLQARLAEIFISAKRIITGNNNSISEPGRISPPRRGRGRMVGKRGLTPRPRRGGEGRVRGLVVVLTSAK